MGAQATGIGTWDKDVLTATGPVLVDFWAPWCGPCRAVGPILDQIDAEYDSLTVVKLNVDEHPQLARDYQITSIPALKVFVGGEVQKTIVGALPRPALERELSSWLRP